MAIYTSVAVPLETAERDLKQLMSRLHWGETVTLVGPGGAPVAMMVSLKPASSEVESSADWWTRWDELTYKISRAWQGDESALEILAEMRR